MTSAFRSLTSAAILASVLAFSAGGASAGAPKAQRVARVEVRRSGTVVATVDQGASSVKIALVQIRSPRSFAAGRGCAVHPTDYVIGQLANRMGLANGVDLVSGANTPGRSAFLMPAGTAFAVAASLNGQVVHDGLARVTGAHGRYRSALLLIERDARRHRRGLWSRCRQG